MTNALRIFIAGANCATKTFSVLQKHFVVDVENRKKNSALSSRRKRKARRRPREKMTDELDLLVLVNKISHSVEPVSVER